MDNPNNPNNPNLNPLNPIGGSPQGGNENWQPTPVDQTANINPDPNSVPNSGNQIPVDPLNQTATATPPPPTWPSDHSQATPAMSEPQWTTNPTPPPNPPQEPIMPPPDQNMSSQGGIPPLPSEQTISANQPQQPWPPEPSNLPQTPEPSQTWPEPIQTYPPAATQESTPLDNPWGSPLSTPAIDQQNQLPQPLASPVDITPSPQGEIPPGSDFPSPTESAPTDLSHLITGNPIGAETGVNPQSNVTVPETLIVPPGGGNPDVPNIPGEEKKGIPMWIFGVGIGLLLVVLGASAYFILGIGQKPQNTSVPATQAPKPTPAPTIAPTPTPQSEATSSGSFGQLGGSGGGQQQATSAADLLRQRQGR